MLDCNLVNDQSRANEHETEDLLNALGFATVPLDRHKKGTRRMPDFLVKSGGVPLFVREVKTIFSGGYLHDRSAHLSTADPDFLGSGLFHHDVDLSRMHECLRRAVGQYRELGQDCPGLQKVSLLVVFFSDPFADRFRFYPSRMDDFPEVSGISKIVDGYEFERAFKLLPLAEQRRRCETGDISGLPGPSQDFLLVENECANVKLPRCFVDLCISPDAGRD